MSSPKNITVTTEEDSIRKDLDAMAVERDRLEEQLQQEENQDIRQESAPQNDDEEALDYDEDAGLNKDSGMITPTTQDKRDKERFLLKELGGTHELTVQESKKRNRRMFGNMLGHLNSAKARLQRDQKGDASLRRAKQSDRIEEKLTRQKANLQAIRRLEWEERRRQDKEKLAKLICDMEKKEVELLKKRLETHYKQMVGYIRTRSQPSVFYLPAKHNELSEELLEHTTMQIDQKLLSIPASFADVLSSSATENASGEGERLGSDLRHEKGRSDDGNTRNIDDQRHESKESQFSQSHGENVNTKTQSKRTEQENDKKRLTEENVKDDGNKKRKNSEKVRRDGERNKSDMSKDHKERDKRDINKDGDRNDHRDRREVLDKKILARQLDNNSNSGGETSDAGASKTGKNENKKKKNERETPLKKRNSSVGKLDYKRAMTKKRDLSEREYSRDSSSSMSAGRARHSKRGRSRGRSDSGK